MGKTKITMLQINTQAPDFKLLDETSTERTLQSFRGRTVLLYFYPKDDTPGCTKEACMIAEVYDDFKALNIVVLGVSKDSPASHKRFKEKYRLPFTLLSDPEGECIEQYGAWGEKSMFGRKFTGINRCSYLINEMGVIVKTYPEVNPATHALEILKDIRNIK
jgi:thioredoxin-dependent peroxiredoxin